LTVTIPCQKRKKANGNELLKELFGSTGDTIYREPTLRCEIMAITFILAKTFMQILIVYSWMY